MKLFSLSLMMSVGLVAAEVAPQVAAPAVMTSTFYGVRPGSLEKAKALMARGDKDAVAVIKNLTKEADKVLDDKPLTVTEKKLLAPSGDKHDYASLSPYRWPNPATADGLPYILKDGEVNPESRDFANSDSGRGLALAKAMRVTCLAYYFTGKEVYADWAINQARVWFVNEETRMNPDLKFAQLIRGAKKFDNKTGMLEGRHLAISVDALALVANAKGWKPGEREAVEAWTAKFFDWMVTNELGKAESESPNNHGTYYDEQVVRWALHLGKTDFAKTVLEAAKKKRIASQIEIDGKQSRELARTNALSYSQFSLRGMCGLAIMGEYVGVDLWNYKSEDGRSIGLAMDYLLPYIDAPRKEWPYKQIVAKKVETPELLPELRMAAITMKKPEYEALVQRNNVKLSLELFLGGM